MFTMPTPEQLAQMNCMEVENKRVECQKTIIELNRASFVIRQEINILANRIHALDSEINEIKTKRRNLGEKITEANLKVEELKTDDNHLKSIFFNKKDGY